MQGFSEEIDASLNLQEQQAYDEFEKILKRMENAVEQCRPLRVRGWVSQVSGTIIRAIVPGVKVGELCRLVNPDDGYEVTAEVVGFQAHEALLTPMGEMLGISNNTEVIPIGKPHQVVVGEHLLGQVVDGLGQPMETAIEESANASRINVYADAPNAMKRKPIEKPLSMGVKAIDGLLSCGEGQRLGIFAAAGGGKSTLLAMLIRNAEVDITVLALIGERGREVREFIERDLGEEGRKKAVLVVATSDRPAMERAKAALVATSIAEYFRDKGKKVLLLMDSVTRYARALREIGLAAGEPPTRRGYPPSVFAALPKLMERAGQSDVSSITALYTVLVEGDDMTEPVADETRSILDGHIILSRDLAAAAHYPAIDILQSTSRVMNAFVSEQHKNAAMELRNNLAKYKEVELLVRIGEYEKGTDSAADKAIDNAEKINQFLKQSTEECVDFDTSSNQLTSMF